MDILFIACPRQRDNATFTAFYLPAYLYRMPHRSGLPLPRTTASCRLHGPLTPATAHAVLPDSGLYAPSGLPLPSVRTCRLLRTLPSTLPATDCFHPVRGDAYCHLLHHSDWFLYPYDGRANDGRTTLRGVYGVGAFCVAACNKLRHSAVRYAVPAVRRCYMRSV